MPKVKRTPQTSAPAASDETVHKTQDKPSLAHPKHHNAKCLPDQLDIEMERNDRMYGVATSTTKCLYFPNKNHIEELTQLLRTFPRSSISGLFAQTVEPMLAALRALPAGERKIHLDVNIWL